MNFKEFTFQLLLTHHSAFYDSESDKYIVSLSPVTDLLLAANIPLVFGQEVHPAILKALIDSTVAHELGHVISGAILHGKSLPEKSAAVRYGDQYMKDFPIKYEGEFDGPLGSSAYETMKEERFAGFFAKDILNGMGLNTGVIDDLNRIRLSEVFGLNVHPDDLTAILAEAINRIFDKKPVDPAHPPPELVLLHSELSHSVLSNTPLAELFPYKQKTVEAILTRAWEEELK